ncbi:tlde1 domain-containing protein [Methylocystis sp. IM3]|jgi:hypothetical protein|uniref:DUF2778 domain-containing protein n=1 Tax=unclassified Methylocystis TaxID=2625913 RepID=UPI000FB78948|nr:MAG: DUF2778 domain-containing protein [Hyphomicrobiales bacterium]
MLTKPQILHGFLSRDRGRFVAYVALGSVALSSSLLIGWHVHRQKGPVAADTLARTEAPAANPYGRMIVGLGPWARTAAAPAQTADTTAALAAKVEPVALEPEAKLDPNLEANLESAEAESVSPNDETTPLPPRRPADLKALASRLAPAPQRQAALAEPAPAPASADTRSFFEKIFGGAGASQQPAAPPEPAQTGRNARRPQQAPAQGSAQVLAYAAPESTGGLFGGVTSPAAPAAPAQSAAVGPAPRAGAGTAVYDISAHTVYMPDGTRLEAHSGLREYLDDPRYVHVRMRGPTPPTVYALTPREALFHGVEALRLTPIGGDSIYGRAGLLAHTYMLGPNGDSNGCVSFRDYNAFLQAYKRGDIRRLVVVARM